MDGVLFKKAKIAFTNWSREHCVPILSVDPKSSENVDLQSIAKSIGDRKFVALSEGFHNCKEMMSLHHRIICYLVENCGFNTILTESGFPESVLVNDYIQGKPIPASLNLWKNGLNKMYSAWEEGRALIEYLKEYNLNNNNSIDYYGVDIGGFYLDWQTPFDRILKYLKNIDSEYCSKLELKLQPYLSLMCTNARKNYSEKLSVTEKANLAAILDEAVNHFNAEEEKYSSESSKKEFECIRQCLISMQLAGNYYHNYETVGQKFVGLNGREIAMQQNCLWVMKQRSDAKIIWIDHVVHTKTKSQHQDENWANFTPAGQLIKQNLGEDFFTIGMAYGSGQFWNKWQRPDERFIDKIPEWDTERRSFEKEINDCLPQSGNYFLDFSSVPKTFETHFWLQSEMSLRENDYYMKIEPQEWDSCIYLDTVSPATAVSV